MANTSPQLGASLERLEDGRPRFTGCSRINDYQFISKLGEGTFGEVSKARSNKTGQVVALKKILMHNEKDGFPITALREIKLLKQLNHVNILKLEEMAIERTKNASKKPAMFMVTPYMDHDLSGLLENPAVHFTEPQIKCYMKQLLEGCAYLHENKILHRDMKAANLLINNRGILQIADFGLARPYDDEPPKPGQGGGDATREYTTLVVTRWYRPPELLLSLRKYTTAIDMWGVGCVFGEMFKGKPILAGNSDLNQAQLIFDLVGSPTDENMPGWRDLPGCDGVKDFSPRASTLDRAFKDQSEVTRSLLREFLLLDWRKRINAIDALRHPYFHTHPLPAFPHQLPQFEESHELDRRKFRDQKSKPPPAPAGGSVGIGPQGEWGMNGRPMPGRGERVPNGGRYLANSHDRRPPPPPPPPPNGRYMPDRSMPRMPLNQPNQPYDSNYRQPPPYDAPPPNQYRGPPPMRSHDEPYSRRPQNYDADLPPRPPAPQGIDPYRYDPHQPLVPPPYHDDRRGPQQRERLPQNNPRDGGAAGYQGPVDTYIPSYSKARPNTRSPANSLGDERRDRRRDNDYPPPRRNDWRREENPQIDYGDSQSRYDDRDRDRIRERKLSGGPTGVEHDRRRSRSPRDRPWQPRGDLRGDDDRYRR